jgi:hypothetical protein
MEEVNWEDIVIQWDCYCENTGTVNNIANYTEWLSENYILYLKTFLYPF